MTGNDWIVWQEDTGIYIKAFLKKKYPHLSLKKIESALDRNLCYVNGRREKMKKAVLVKGYKVFFDEGLFLSQDIAFTSKDVLYEDNYFLFYNKPAHLICDQPSINKFFKQKLFLCHRLDKETTGVLAFAKDEKALAAMEDLFKKRDVEKLYLTIVDKALHRSSGTINKNMIRHLDSKGNAIWETASEGLYAKTRWECIFKKEHYSLVRCFPETGRTHQIRVHMKSIGHPLVGDWHYASSFATPLHVPNFFLHAKAIRFFHPFQLRQIEVQAPLPKLFSQTMQTFFGHSSVLCE